MGSAAIPGGGRVQERSRQLPRAPNQCGGAGRGGTTIGEQQAGMAASRGGGRGAGGAGGASESDAEARTHRRIIVAAGGRHRRKLSTASRRKAGGLTGSNGLTGSYLGGGATQSAGGIPNGVLGIGGAGGTGQTGGGGGGGYYGGGGSPWEGGGGGSSYVTTVGASGVVHTAGFRTGNGTVVFSWNANGCVANVRTPITVTIDSLAPTALCQSDTVHLDSLGNGSLVASELDGGSTDNCSVASLSISQTSFTCANAGLTT